MVALRKESVDRNCYAVFCPSGGMMSLSARRAWIEITHAQYHAPGRAKSLSARRAWIEISMSFSVAKRWAVALRKESVDRNRHCRNLSP